MRIYDSLGIVKVGVAVAFANPSGTIGLTAVNGSALTAMRSDAAPALSQAIIPVWTGQHVWTGSATETLLIMRNTSAGTDLKNVLIRTGNAGQFQVWSATDAAPTVAVTSLIQGARTAAAWTSVTFGNNTDNPLILFQGASRFQDGAFGTPSISFINDPDTGLYRSASNVMDVTIGGARAFAMNGVTATGAQTATFVATNKPGSGAAGPIAWLPVLTAAGTQGYIPVFGA